ncbi:MULTISPECIES: 4'-phosphopantetheinyl transferase family protein [unclassified Marinobacter]|uniref:4'-phosphopantetheinyl transferase family protein n=1 Tax=unclassified Marinobacter TaxID=83889 RepID=UPI0030097371
MLSRPQTVRKHLELDRLVLVVAQQDLRAASIKYATLEEKLSSVEMEKFKAFKDGPSSWGFAVGRLITREVISQIYGIKPSEVSIQIQESGRPRIEYPGGLGVSISHSGPFVALALSSDGECGVDIESSEALPACLPIHDRFFSTQEKLWLEEAGNRLDKGQRFLRLWTRKEAYLKATGQGLAGLSSQLDFAGLPRCNESEGRTAPFQLNGFWVFDVVGSSDYCLSACVNWKPSTVDTISLQIGALEI